MATNIKRAERCGWMWRAVVGRMLTISPAPTAATSGDLVSGGTNMIITSVMAPIITSTCKLFAPSATMLATTATRRRRIAFAATRSPRSTPEPIAGGAASAGSVRG
jgi:hypothetical protein